MSKYLDENGVRKILSKVKYLGDGSTGTGTGTSDYNQLTNKPSINGIRLLGDKSLSDLGIQALGNYANASDIPTRLSQLTNDRNYLTEVPSEYKTKNENDDLYQEKGNYIVDNNYVHTDNNYTTTEKSKLASLENYVLPTASKTVIGGIKVGANLTIDRDGTLNATGGEEGTTNYNDLQNKPSINGITLSGNKSLSDLNIEIPSKLSELTNDSGYITNYIESDPTVPTHVKNITTSDINNWNSKSNFDGSYNSLNNKPSIPTKLSELTNDSGYIKNFTESDPTVPTYVKNITQADISNWNSKSNFNGNYNDLSNKPSIPSKTSQLTNDSGFITSVPNTYATKDYVDDKIGDIANLLDILNGEVV